VVLMTLLGGMGTVIGPVVGAAVVVTLQTELADKVGSLVTVIMGLLFVFCVLVFRRGIVGEGIALYRRMIGEKTR
jgi:branched-chain amino acid transport system permease protein